MDTEAMGLRTIMLLKPDDFQRKLKSGSLQVINAPN